MSAEESKFVHFMTLTAESCGRLTETERALLGQQLDTLGAASGVAQGLKVPITSLDKLLASSPAEEVVVVVALDAKSVPCGYLKYGFKSLYLHKKGGQLTQCRPVCLLDFYVDETRQRQGIGKLLFSRFLEMIHPLAAADVAYDRPSPKLYPFLKKHFGLVNHEASPYGFSVFPGFPY